MKAIQIISQDLFDKVRSRFRNLEMGNETGAVTIDPTEARFFDFDFVLEGTNLGRISISLNELGTLKVYYSQGITENQDTVAKKVWFDFLKEMRYFAMRRLLRFDTRDIAKTNLDKNDFQHLATTQGPKEDPDMNTMNESRWNQKSSSKTSRAVQGTTEVIVRHANPVDEEYAGSRSQKKNIKAIFIQNKDGERFKYPFIHTAGAFAMAQHVDHGGIPHDQAGKAIIRMSEEIAQLGEFQRKIQRTSLHDDATGIAERAIGRLQELKVKIESLGKRHHYESWMAEMSTQAPMGDDIMELDAVTMEQYKQTFTQSTFQEELAGYFPLLHRIMSETNKVDLESYVKEEQEECEKCHCDPCECDDKEVKESMSTQFEEWAEATEQGKLTDDQVSSLQQAITELPDGKLELGPDGQTAWQFFSEFGLDDNDLEEKLKAAAELDPETDSLEVLQIWARDNYPELLVALGISGTEAPAEPAPVEPAPVAPEQPVAEDPEDNQFTVWYMIDDGEWEEHGTFNNEAAVNAYLEKCEEQGYDMDNFEVRKPGEHPDDNYNYTSPEQPVAEAPEDRTSYQVAKVLFDKGITYDSANEGDLVRAIGMVLVKELNMSPKEARNLISYDEDFLSDTMSELQHMDQDEQSENSEMMPHPGAMESKDPKAMVKMIAEKVKSFYNADNESVGPFHSNEGILIDIEKECTEQFGPEAGEQGRQMAEAFMEKLTKQWEERHGKSSKVGAVDSDDGLARLKELLGNVKAKVEGIAQENGPDKSQVPAYKRKEQGGDWKMSTKDLEKEKTNSPTSSAGLARRKAELGLGQNESEALEAIMRIANYKK